MARGDRTATAVTAKTPNDTDGLTAEHAEDAEDGRTATNGGDRQDAKERQRRRKDRIADYIEGVTVSGFFKRNEKVRINDPVFGQIEFDQQHDVDMWCHASADEDEHMILIDAPATGPTPAQRDFYSSLQRDLDSRLEECKAFIAGLDDAPQNLSQMTIYSVEIGPGAECNAGQFVIELSDEQADEIHRVEFRNWKPAAYGVDD